MSNSLKQFHFSFGFLFMYVNSSPFYFCSMSKTIKYDKIILDYYLLYYGLYVLTINKFIVDIYVLNNFIISISYNTIKLFYIDYKFWTSLGNFVFELVIFVKCNTLLTLSWSWTEKNKKRLLLLFSLLSYYYSSLLIYHISNYQIPVNVLTDHIF